VFGDKTKKVIETTVGRVIFSEIWPDELGFPNKVMGKSNLGDIIWKCYKFAGHDKTVESLDNLKELGFQEATRSGCSIGIASGGRGASAGGAEHPERTINNTIAKLIRYTSIPSPSDTDQSRATCRSPVFTVEPDPVIDARPIATVVECAGRTPGTCQDVRPPESRVPAGACTPMCGGDDYRRRTFRAYPQCWPASPLAWISPERLNDPMRAMALTRPAAGRVAGSAVKGSPRSSRMAKRVATRAVATAEHPA